MDRPTLKKRIYVGNLPFDTTESDVNKKFSRFGKVLALEMKYRSDVGLPCYAFLDLETDDIDKCFKKLLRKKWKGHSIKLQLARESFLSRLDEERLNDAVSPIVGTGNEPVCNRVKFTTADHNHTSINHLDFTDANVEPMEDEMKTTFTTSVMDALTTRAVVSARDDLLSERTVVDKLEAFSDVWRDPPSSAPSDAVQVKRKKRKENYESGLTEEKLKLQRNLVSEEKRLKSLEEKKKSFLQQKEAVKKALSSVDVQHKASNKLIFDVDDGEVAQPTAPNPQSNDSSHLNHHVPAQSAHGTKNKQSLFDDDESADEDVQEKDFQIKRQFEGKKGQKLLALQSHYANDQRFALDERFYESDENPEQEEHGNEVPASDEVKRQMEILQSIVGHELPHTPELRKNNMKGVDNFMLRYDPTVSDHTQYETKEPEPVLLPESKKPLKKQKVASEKKAIKAPVKSTNVSQEKFYKVADNLKESLRPNESSGFSLLEMFGSKVDKETAEEVEEVSLPRVPVDKQAWTANPFKYDSSDSEGEGTPESKGIRELTKSISYLPNQAIRPPMAVWKESFFFKSNDIRFSEGLEFFASPKNVGENFSELRRDLQQIVNVKLKHNLRKSATKKKMMGGNKFKMRGRK